MTSDGAPLNLFWWNEHANFGDLISPLIVSHVSGRAVTWAAPEKADIFALGSIMRYVAEGANSGRTSKPWVWGTGVIAPTGALEFVPKARFAAVRGPRTANVLKLRDLPFGDPGILIADVLGPPNTVSGDIGIIPHFSQRKNPQFAEILSQTADARVIDVTRDACDVVAEIAGCRHVFSSSLHGLVVADAYGIPNTWLNPEGIHRNAKFKFRDYGLAIGRDMPEYAEIIDIPRLAKECMPAPLPYAAGLEAAKAALKAAFPAELAA